MAVLTPEQAFRRAYERHRSGITDEAVALCRAILKSEPGHPHATLLLALIVDRDGREAEAERLLADAVERCACSIVLESPPPDAPRHCQTPNPALHALLGSDRTDAYNGVLESFVAFLPRLSALSIEEGGDGEPHWRNLWIGSFDAIALYSFTASRRPRRYVEVGSGISTRFVRRAVRDHGLITRITSIDPEPRAEIDSLCDEILRLPLEKTNLAAFAGLAAGDIVFIDSSHRSFMGSDVTVFFTEVLPLLPAGVAVGLHDIYLPFDYPEEWVPRYYNEQYLLACYLLGGNALEVLLPLHFVLKHPACAAAVGRIATALPRGIAVGGTSFWLLTTGGGPVKAY